MVVPACNSSAWEAEPRPAILRLHWAPWWFQAGLSSRMNHCFRQTGPVGQLSQERLVASLTPWVDFWNPPWVERERPPSQAVLSFPQMNQGAWLPPTPQTR